MSFPIGVTRWIHNELNLGVSTGTDTIHRRRSFNASATNWITSRYVTTSVPPMSNVSPTVRGSARHSTRYLSTSPTAIGWHFVDTHRGVTITGNRSTRYRKISNDADPEPTIIAARNTVTFTPVDDSSASTSRRDRRCSDSPVPVSPNPPR